MNTRIHDANYARNGKLCIIQASRRYVSVCARLPNFFIHIYMLNILNYETFLIGMPSVTALTCNTPCFND